MLVFVDGLAHIVLSLVETVLLSLSQMSVVSGHISLLRIFNFLLTVFNTRSLSRCERAVLDAIRDAVLLVRLAAIDLVDARMTGIDLSRTGLRLSRGGANKHQTTRCQD